MNRFVAALLCAALVGCTSYPVKLDNIDGARFDESRPLEVTAEACGAYLFFGFIPASSRSRQRRARDWVQARVPDRVLTHVRITESWSWLFFATTVCTQISATAYPKLP